MTHYLVVLVHLLVHRNTDHCPQYLLHRNGMHPPPPLRHRLLRPSLRGRCIGSIREPGAWMYPGPADDVRPVERIRRNRCTRSLWNLLGDVVDIDHVVAMWTRWAII